MAVFNLFSKRERKAPEVLTYDDIPRELRIQMLYAFNDAVQRIYDRTIPAYRAIGTEGIVIGDNYPSSSTTTSLSLHWK